MVAMRKEVMVQRADGSPGGRAAIMDDDGNGDLRICGLHV